MIGTIVPRLKLQDLLRFRSFGQVLTAHKGLGPGFDHIRIMLSLVIFSVHASAIVHGRSAAAVVVITTLPVAPTAFKWLSWREPLYMQMVPMFFALSGFLVTGSAERLKSVRTFLTFRVLRILPALLVETLLSALIIGPAVTNLSPSEYFLSPLLYRYLGNIVGAVFFFLPGVFVDNPIAGIVNNSLWTLPSEFYCYAVMSIMMVSGVLSNRRLLVVIFAALTVALWFYGLHERYGLTKGNFPLLLLVHSFLCGCMLYRFQNRIKFNVVFCLAAEIIAYTLIESQYLFVFSTAAVSYFTICLGMVAWPRLPLIQRGDYSYGIYLYGFPICQALVAFHPAFTAQALIYRVTGLLLTILFAVASWHLLEKPFLRLKRYLVLTTPKPPVPVCPPV